MNEEHPADTETDQDILYMFISGHNTLFKIRLGQHGPEEGLQKEKKKYLQDKIWLSASKKLLPRANDG